MLKIHTLKALETNFVYVLEGPDKVCAVVDPGEALPVIEFIKQEHLELTHILCTHHHQDHIQGIPDLIKSQKTKIEVITSKVDGTRIPNCTQTVDEFSDLNFALNKIKILPFPGHTLGQIGFYVPHNEALFCGDTLFSAGCGRLFEGTAQQMFETLQSIKKLPTSTQIYFGHEYTLKNLDFVLSRKSSKALLEYRESISLRLNAGLNSAPTSLATELEVNPFLRAQDLEEFVEWRSARDHW